jgi:mono/diheme cytochrome c family protein
MPASRWAAVAAAVALTVIASSPLAAQVALPTPGPAPNPRGAGTFGFGRPATAEEISKIDIDVRGDGRGLPAGSGTADQGRPIFTQKCAGCHGASGEGSSIAPKLVDPTPYVTGVTTPTIGNYWPYATTVWDYIHRAMPFDMPGSLSPDEVYALTAYLLSENQIIATDAVIDARSLPKVNMPNAGGFSSPDPRPDTP